MTNFLPLTPAAWTFLSAYLLSLILVGWFGYRARREDTLSDFYLAGTGFGLIVLFLTLYATQYSGNTLFGYTGKAYRIGFSWIMSVQFMTAIIVCYLMIAPRLYRMARERGYITPVDYLQDRYASVAISLIATIILIIVLSNYLLAQLMAMGRAMQGLSKANPDLAYQYGVILLTLIIVIYGTLGGIRAVAWTDAIQGLVLLLGFGVLITLVVKQYGPLTLVTQQILASPDPSIVERARPPDANRLREWFSYIVMIGLGSVLYPQAIQRLYAARSAKVLRRSLAFMALMPLLTALIAVVIGVYAIVHVPGLEGAASDQVLARVLGEIQQGSAFSYWLVVLLLAAILAAMMSTADSALLSISSMLSNDIYGRYIRPRASQAELTRVGKYVSWILIALLVWLAIVLRNHASLLSLLDRKFDLLVQLVPGFMLGLHWSRLATGPVLLGLVTGVMVSLTLAFGGFAFVENGKIAGFHPGLFALLVNGAIAVTGSLISACSGRLSKWQ